MIKYKRTGNTLVTVVDGTILAVQVPDTTIEDFSTELKGLISSYNVETDEELKLSLKSQVINKMIPPTKQMEIDKKLIDDRDHLAHIETYENAYEDKEECKKIADISGTFEYDEQGRVYLEGFSVPIPNELAQALLDAKYNSESKYSIESLVNFWKWALLNPNQKARVDLFGWFNTGKFVITEEGFILAYRNVNVKQKGHTKKFDEFISKAYIKAKGQKKSPKHFGIFKVDDNEWESKFIKDKPNKKNKDSFIGMLSDLHADIDTKDSCTVYTDNHTGKMNIKLGEEVSMPREDCDEDHQASCSRGLHFMSPAYGLRLGSTTIVVLINPYNIVAFPSYDNTKGRTCAYMPIGLAEKKDGKIVELDSGSYDFDYSGYSSATLDEMLGGKSLSKLKEQNLIASDITEKDFTLVKDSISEIIKGRLEVIEQS